MKGNYEIYVGFLVTSMHTQFEIYVHLQRKHIILSYIIKAIVMQIPFKKHRFIVDASKQNIEEQSEG